MADEVGREYRLEVQSTVGAAMTVTAITNANPAVATSTAHGLANGDYVIITDVEGMPKADNLVARVANVDANTFELEGINSTGWGTFTSGEATKVTAWQTVASATAIDYGAGSAEEIDMTRLLDATRRVENGILTLPAVSVSLFADPPSTVQAAIEAAAYANTTMAWRATTKNGRKRVWAGTPSTIGESVSVNSPITGSFTINVKSTRYVHYAT